MRILDKDLNLKARLNPESWQYNRRRNVATDISVTVAKNELRRVLPTDGRLYQELAREGILHLTIANFVQIYKGNDLRASGVIVERDVGDDTIEIKAFTEEILLERNRTPAQYGSVFRGQDIADVARELTTGWQTIRVKAESEWKGEEPNIELVESENIDFETQSNVIMLDKTPLGNYYEEGYLILRLDSEDYSSFASWDRIRWSADNEEPVETSIQYRYANTINDLESEQFSQEFEGVIPDEEGLVPAATDERYVDIRINLSTQDTDSEDGDGNPVGSTPFFFALELIANTEFALEVGEIPNSTGVTVGQVDADGENCLSILKEICDTTGYEFQIKNKKLSIAETFGENLTDSVMLRKGTNMEINNLGDDDGDLVNILTAYGEGDGINRISTTIRDGQSIEDFGEYTDTEEFETNNLAELTSMAQDYINANNTPVTSFDIDAKFDPGNEPNYKYGDKVKIVDPESQVITDIKIDEEERSYSDNGLEVRLRLGRVANRFIDGVVDRRVRDVREIPTPRLTARGIARGIKINARFESFEGWSETRYYVGVEEQFELSGEFLLKRDRSREVELGGLLPGREYYAKAVNVDELGNVSETSESVRVRTASEATGATLFVAAQDSSVRGRAGADFVCDGEDDQVEIQQAINEIPENGGSVVLLEGEFVITDTINIGSNVTLKGQGKSTIIKGREAGSGNYEMISPSGENIEISDMRLNGNKSNLSTVTRCISSLNLENSLIRNIIAEDSIERNISVGGEETKVLDCVSRNGGNIGIDAYGNIGGEVRGCVIRDNDGIGIRMGGKTDIDSNFISGNGNNGIYIEFADESTIENNELLGNRSDYDNSGGQIYLSRTSDCFIHDNYVRLGDGGARVVIERGFSDIPLEDNLVSNNDFKDGAKEETFSSGFDSSGGIKTGAGNRMINGDWSTSLTD